MTKKIFAIIGALVVGGIGFMGVASQAAHAGVMMN
jgi:hypothetical protein